MSLENADHNSTHDERQESMTQGDLAQHNRQMAPPTISSVQLNIVTSIDVAGATYTGRLDGKVGLMDNSAKSTGKGTTALKTVCKQGQILNWLIYARDMQQRPDNSWPPSARIVNIVFLNSDGTVRETQTCNPLRVFGGPEKIRSPSTPVYYYWAGEIKPDIKPGIYHYRLVIQCDTPYPGTPKFFNLDGPSLEILPMDDFEPA